MVDSSRIRTLRSEAAVFLLFVAITVVLTWPLAIRLTTATSDLGDPLLSTWIINWDQYAGLRFPHRIFQAPVFYPATYPLAFSENMIGIAIASLPFYLAGLKPLVVYNLAMILGFAFCGYGAYGLGMTVARSRPAAVIAGILYAFVPYRMDHLAHIQIVWSGWMPLILAMLLRYWRRPTRGNAAMFGVCVLMNGLTNIHWLLFGTAAAAITIVVLGVLEPRDRKFWIPLAIAGGLAVLLLVPILLPYRTVSQLYQMRRDRSEAQWGSAVWYDWLAASARSRTYGHLVDPEKTTNERFLFPGLMGVLLTAAAFLLHRWRADNPVCPDRQDCLSSTPLRILDGLMVVAAIVAYWGMVAKVYEFRIRGIHLLTVHSSNMAVLALLMLAFVRLTLQLPKVWWKDDRPRSLRTALAESRLPLEFWTCVLWIAIGVIGSLGLNAFFHSVLFEYVEAFQALRIPARWAMVAYTGLAGTAALGAAELIERRERWPRHLVTGLLVTAALIDVRPTIRWEHAVPGVDPVYRWLRTVPIRGGTLELPVVLDAAQFFYVYGATEHHRPIMNGTSGFEPPVHARIREQASASPIPDTLLSVLEKGGAQLVIVHEDWLREFGEPTRQWLRPELQRGRLAFIRRFDHRAAGDWVFAVTKNLSEWRSLVPPLEPDGAGLLPAQNLERMLNGETTYMSRTFGRIDSPRWWEEIRGPLTISGWAASPNGIRSIDVLAHNGTRRWRTERIDRGDVEAKYPWYPRGHVVGFMTTIPKRPRGIPRVFEFQVEITDGVGNRTRLPDMFIVW